MTDNWLTRRYMPAALFLSAYIAHGPHSRFVDLWRVMIAMTLAVIVLVSNTRSTR